MYQLARRAKDENNTALAAKYYNQIVVENPDDWEAVFYSTYYTAMECKIAEIATAATTITNNFLTVFKLIAENVQEEKRSDIFAEISTRISALSQILENAAVEHYNSHMSVSGVFSESSARITAIIYMVEKFADYMKDALEAYSESLKEIIGDHTLKLVNENSIQGTSESIINQRNTIMDRMNTLRKKLASQVKEL